MSTINIALAEIAAQAEKTTGRKGGYHITATLVADANGERLYYTVTYFAPGVVNYCTQGSGSTPEEAIAELVRKLSSTASRAADLKLHAANLIAQAEAIDGGQA